MQQTPHHHKAGDSTMNTTTSSKKIDLTKTTTKNKVEKETMKAKNQEAKVKAETRAEIRRLNPKEEVAETSHITMLEELTNETTKAKEAKVKNSQQEVVSEADLVHEDKAGRYHNLFDHAACGIAQQLLPCLKMAKTAGTFSKDADDSLFFSNFRLMKKVSQFFKKNPAFAKHQDHMTNLFTAILTTTDETGDNALLSELVGTAAKFRFSLANLTATVDSVEGDGLDLGVTHSEELTNLINDTKPE
jgi:hypothetical protein